MNELGPIGTILGNEECKHEAVTYYSGYEGVYAVCRGCGGHFWDAVPPEGEEIIDLMRDPDEDFTECSHGIARDETCPDCDELTVKYRAYMAAPASPEGSKE